MIRRFLPLAIAGLLLSPIALAAATGVNLTADQNVAKTLDKASAKADRPLGKVKGSAALADSITGGDSSAKVDKAAGKVDKAKGRVNSAASKANASAQGKLNGVGLGGGVR
jgi:phosphomevalonate kinase